MKKNTIAIHTFISTIFCWIIFPVTSFSSSNPTYKNYRSDCTLPSAEINLEINNIRARLSAAGVMWRHGFSPGYAAPKLNDTRLKKEVHMIYAGAFWLCGYDEFDNLKVAANTYRSQTSQDFWPGPIDETNGTTNSQACHNWDRFFEVKGDDIRAFRYLFQESLNSGNTMDRSKIPQSLLAWPGSGNPHFAGIHGFELNHMSSGFAPYFDNNVDGIYNPEDGDYPVLSFGSCGDQVYADQMVYSVFNDVGNVHTSSRGFPVGAEIHLMDYAYSSDDVLNDVTFKQYTMILRNPNALVNTFASIWADPDLGCFSDDYMGCDSSRSLAYVYNSNDLDGGDINCAGTPSYGAEIPMLGIDLLSGPGSAIGHADPALTSFMSIPNTSFMPPHEGSPAILIFRYASGKWGDGTPITKGGTGYNTQSNDITKYMFAGRPDLDMEWSMCQSSPASLDLRAVMSSGPFRWEPGNVHIMDVGLVYVPSISHPCPDIDPLLRADEEMQAAFDACFQLESEGPIAPFATIKARNKSLMLTWNYDQLPAYTDNLKVQIQGSESMPDERHFYKWEGIKIFQLRDANVNRAQLNDTNFARQVFQCDLENEVDTIHNWIKQVQTGDYISNLMVTGNNLGLEYEIQISNDLFDQGNPLKRRKDYHFALIAYSHNDYDPFDPDEVGKDRKSYLESAVFRYIKGRLYPAGWDDGNEEEMEDVIRTPLTGVQSRNGLISEPECETSSQLRILDLTGKVITTIDNVSFTFSNDKFKEDQSWQQIYLHLQEFRYHGIRIVEIRGNNGERRVRKFVFL